MNADLNEKFDCTDVVQKEFFPLMDKIHELAEKHNLPFVIAVMVASEGDGSTYTIASTGSTKSRTRTPDELLVAGKMLRDKLESGLILGIKCLSRRSAEVDVKAENYDTTDGNAISTEEVAGVRVLNIDLGALLRGELEPPIPPPHEMTREQEDKLLAATPTPGCECPNCKRLIAEQERIKQKRATQRTH